jgi:hypothetical protein
MEVPVLVVCASCGSGSILHVEPNEFLAVLAEEAHGRLWFRKQVECPDCKSMIELEFALDTKTGQAKSDIHVRKPKKTFLVGLFGGSSKTAVPPAAPEAPSAPAAAPAEPSARPAVQAEPPAPVTAEAGTPPASAACKAFQAGRCVVNGADTGACDWDPSNWRNCNVVIENTKYGAW